MVGEDQGRAIVMERDEILQTIGKQYDEVMGPLHFNYDKLPHVTCPCKKRVSIFHAYQCLYCAIWFCKKCAKEHFGPEHDEKEKLN